MGHSTGLLLGIGAALLWGTSGPFMRIAYTLGITVVQVNLVRFTFSTLVLLLIAIAKDPELLKPSRMEKTPLFWLGTCGMLMSALGLNLAFLHISVGLAMVIYYSAPCWVMAGSWLLGRDRPSCGQLVAFGLAIAGIWVAVEGAGTMGTLDIVGFAGALTGAIGYALYVLNGHYGTGRDAPFRSFVHTYMLSMTILWVIGSALGNVTGLMNINIRGWLVLGYLAFATSLIPFGLLILALGRVSASVASIATMCEVPFSMMWAWLICSEIPEKVAVIGGAMVLFAIAILSMETPIPNRFHRRRTGRWDI
ncbi:MAG: EamA family transporter [Synergistales bacterium]|nr:EamA family transporter [Synergistales bacterium]